MTSPRPGRNPWPYVPVFILLATILANIALIHLAITTDDGLVERDPVQQRAPKDSAHP